MISHGLFAAPFTTLLYRGAFYGSRHYISRRDEVVHVMLQKKKETDHAN